MPAQTTVWNPPHVRRLFFMGIFLVIASLFDAWMTLEFIALGGEEANDFLLPILSLGPATFLVWKVGIGLSVATLFIFTCQRKRWIWWSFNFVIWSYIALTALHFFIVLHIR